MGTSKPNAKTQAMDDDSTRLSPNSHSVKSAQPSPSAYPNYLTIMDVIGQGGIGRVYLGYDETIGRRVAVKELLDEFTQTSEVVNSFVHEAKITGKLEHPGITPVYELGKRNDGQPYYVMRYVKGETLEQRLKKANTSDNEQAFSKRIKLLDTLIGVCDTVAYAHAKGVIHRDLKPANVISGSFGETIVLDWGLAQVVDDSDNTYFYREVLSHQRHTLSDLSNTEVLGSPAYMAPEQFQGLSSKASDVYSLGVILYRLLSGELPYHGSITEIQQKTQNLSPSPSVKTINPAAPAELIAICDKAMHKNADERFANAAELAHQLKAFRDGRVVNIYSYSRQELLRRFLNQNKILVTMATLLAVAIIGGAGFSLYYAKQMQQAKQHAEESLVVVTAYGEQAQKEARTIARSINNASQRLFADLNQAASLIEPSDPSKSQTILNELKNRYPKFDDIFLRNAQEISAVFSKFSEDNALNILRPIAEIQNNHLTFSFRVPILRNGQTVSYLEARMSPEKVMPNFIPLDTHSATHPRHVWIMRDDGLIAFDEIPEDIGSNLFIDPSTNQSSSLQAFARQMLLEDDSIGYYTSTNQETETHKIAAWDTVSFGNSHSWKVIVNYDYLSQDVASQPLL